MLGLNRLETVTLFLAFAFGLFGWLLSELVDEYIALVVCVPPPVMYYIYGLMKNADPKKGAGTKSQ